MKSSEQYRKMITEEVNSDCPNPIRLKALSQLVKQAEERENTPIAKPVYKRIYVGHTINHVTLFEFRTVRKQQ